MTKMRTVQLKFPFNIRLLLDLIMTIIQMSILFNFGNVKSRKIKEKKISFRNPDTDSY